MKYYTKKIDPIVAFKLDFSNDEKILETIKNLSRFSHTLIYHFGDKGYRVKLENSEEEFTDGDYIYSYIYGTEWLGCHSPQFEMTWEEREINI